MPSRLTPHSAHPSWDHADIAGTAPSRVARRTGPKAQGAQGHDVRRPSRSRRAGQLLHAADAAVLPSHYEPFGIVALEAAATGIPLVTSNVGGLGEAVINGADRHVLPAARHRRPGRSCPRRPRRPRRRPAHGRSPRANGSRRTSTGTRSPARPRRCTSPPNAVSANRTGGAPSSNTRSRTGRSHRGGDRHVPFEPKVIGHRCGTCPRSRGSRPRHRGPARAAPAVATAATRARRIRGRSAPRLICR